MCRDDINTKILVPLNHLVWPPFLKVSCFLNTIASSSRNCLLICKVAGRGRQPRPGLSPLSGHPSFSLVPPSGGIHQPTASQSVLGSPFREFHSFSQDLLRVRGACRHVSPTLPPCLSESVAHLVAPAPTVLQAVQMASREDGKIKGSKGTKCHLAASGVSRGW